MDANNLNAAQKATLAAVANTLAETAEKQAAALRAMRRCDEELVSDDLAEACEFYAARLRAEETAWETEAAAALLMASHGAIDKAMGGSHV